MVEIYSLDTSAAYTLRAVVVLMFSASAIFRQDMPFCRRDRTVLEETGTCGRPSLLPLARACANPERTRSRISSRSSSAIEAKIPNISLPFGVLVSTPSCSA